MQWSPRAAETAALAVVALGLTGSAVLLDTAGRLLVGMAAVLLAALVLRDLLLRPRLTAGPRGVDVAMLTGRHHLPWTGLRVTVRETSRLGVGNRTLELDVAAGPDDPGRLIVLGRRELGADPAEVARRLAAVRPTA